MSINSVASANDILSQYAIAPQEKKKSNELGQDAFMQLLITQMNNQSPLDPQDNTQFISQLAQFSSLEGIQQLNNTVSATASQFRSAQALQASSMVGRSVFVPANSGTLQSNGSISGFVELDGYTNNLRISVYNGAGELVRQIDMGSQNSGEVEFKWDGKNDKGEQLPAGSYTLRAEASNGGVSEQLQTYISCNVNSVSIAKNGALTLNLAGHGPVAIEDVRQIN